MAGYTSAHLSNIENRVPISPYYLEKGMVAEIYYMKTSGGKKELKKYVILVLQPLFQQKMHALKLDNVAPTILNKFVNNHGLAISKRMAKVKKIEMPKMIMDSSSQQFYNSAVKSLLGSSWKDTYRTFTFKQIMTATALNYNFNNIPIEPELK